MRDRQPSENNEFAEWFRMTREDRQMTEEQAAEHLDLSLDSILRIEGGLVPWPTLSRDIKLKIESKFGEYRPLLDSGEHALLGEYRQLDLAENLESVKEVEKDLGLLKQQLEEEAIDFLCGRCRTPVRIKDQGRCPKCERLGDGSQ